MSVGSNVLWIYSFKQFDKKSEEIKYFLFKKNMAQRKPFLEVLSHQSLYF
jgi:hypothetical protein